MVDEQPSWTYRVVSAAALAEAARRAKQVALLVEITVRFNASRRR